MNKVELISRNKKFVVAVNDLLEVLPKTMANNVFAKQLLRCSSSVGANYRSACRAKSSADFINKLKIVEEETDESIYFLELIDYVDNGINKDQIRRLLKEADELLAIYVTSIKTVKSKIKNHKSNQESKIVNLKS